MNETDSGARPLDELLGRTFSDPALLRQALTHASSTAEAGTDNERLEFLGDAVLGLVICEHLYRSAPEADEGELTEVKSAVVSRAALAREARRLGLQEHLILGGGIGRKALPASVLANAIEAIVGAIHLDGGLEAARRFVLDHLGNLVEACRARARAHNHKSELQEIAQKRYRSGPEYRLVESHGPEHAKRFIVAVAIAGTELGSGSGASKKEAEQEAARAALEAILREEG